jgi:exosortase F-associated protein
MLKEIRNNKLRFLFIFLSLIGLVCVRFFEDVLFYDPFLNFFKSHSQNQSVPELNDVKLFFGFLFRYTLNTFFSLSIIYLLFKQLQLVKFSAILFLVLFLLFVSLFFVVLRCTNEPDYLILFYLRRFLIQPLFLILFIPAFYYQQFSK